MIDYYKGKDIESSREYAYLHELTLILNKEKSADDNYQAIEALKEELGSREAYNNLDESSERLMRELELVKQIFISEESKKSYDVKLKQAYQNLEQSILLAPSPAYQPAETELVLPTSGPTKQHKKLKWFLRVAQVLFLLLVAGVSLWFRINLVLLFIFIAVAIVLALLLDA